ncbi:IclR family transcriptional regulator [Paracoccus sp. PAR01]|uniref:IclR family transcriptional regulator n=1 Tax=Paracoccus sp. PAR01 TaxID=2769282 RepID=UPI001782B76D|nr:IclR family transcriptional regulator [Paracoccus sp. PAR01]MBD9529862.1 IclR family transcriptional regulator [Paracoccus sp. PAR01]
MPDESELSANRNPAIEKMMAILTEIERQPNGLPLGKVAEAAGVTRSTAYRILNSLLAHDMLRQLDNAHFVLGSRLLSLADSVTVGALGSRVATAAQPVIDEVSRTLGETVKVSVNDRGQVVVVAISLGRKARALQAQLGEHLPIHAGAGSKVLLAHSSKDEIDRVLDSKLPIYTERTLSDPQELLAELEKIRQQGWSNDPGEFDLSVRAYAAPIKNRQGQVTAALSIPFFADVSRDYEAALLYSAQTAARRISDML